MARSTPGHVERPGPYLLLVFEGSGRTQSCGWEGYALLRDNVQHYLENGQPSARFSTLHSLEAALDGRATLVNAARLREELLSACQVLWQVPIKHAAISIRTRAILTGASRRPRVRGTVKAQAAGWRLPLSAPDTTPVPLAAELAVSVMLTLTQQAVDGDTLRVTRRKRRSALSALPRSLP